MDTINEFFSTVIYHIQVFLFGTRVKGEPANFNQSLPPERSDEGFFEWCCEYKVGCRTHNKPTFY